VHHLNNLTVPIISGNFSLQLIFLVIGDGRFHCCASTTVHVLDATIHCTIDHLQVMRPDCVSIFGLKNGLFKLCSASKHLQCQQLRFCFVPW
jgi:hypothetical protein